MKRAIQQTEFPEEMLALLVEKSFFPVQMRKNDFKKVQMVASHFADS